MPFALTANPNLNEISDAINYLLNNFGSNVSIDLTTGIIAGPSGRISNLYKYISIKYATSYDGTVGFSNVPTGATYYGIRNSNDSTESTNPADYIWYKTTGFGSTNYLWYIVAGGRQIDFYVSPTQPSDYYVKDPGTAIDIDIVTTTKTQNVAIPAIYQWTSGSAPARPTTTSTYTWSTASYSAPSGWSTTPTSNSTPGYVQWAIFVPITANSNVATSVVDWTNTGYPIVQFSSNGNTGATGGNGLSALTAYLQQSQSSTAPSTPANTTGPTAPSGWSLSAPTSVTVGNVVYYTFGQYNSTSSTLNGIPAGQTQWGVPTAASIFQDIRSDNWNGNTPPTLDHTNPSTWGTAGYYIERSTGYMYLNSIYARGQAVFNGATLVDPTNNYYAAITANKSLGQNFGIEAYSNNTFPTSGGVRAYNQNTGAGGNALYAYHSGSGVGVLGQTASGTGIQGTGATGILGSGTRGVSGAGSSGDYGIYGINTSGGTAIFANGYYGTNNSTLVTNLYADLAKTLVGTGGANQLRFVSGTSTGTSAATFSATKPGAASTNVWITMQIDATTIYIPVWT
jgi:hypothetical protein